MKKRIQNIRLLTLALLSAPLATFAENGEKSLVDFFLPMEPQSELVSTGIWGNPNVLPRDTANGLEDPTLKNWCYWDGSIVKDDEGRYHLYASRWSQTYAHSTGWKDNSMGMHAVSDNIMGPYKDMGLTWPNWKAEGEARSFNGIGHNVSGFRLHDGRYGIVTSEITPGVIFVSDSPDGPFEYLGQITWDANGYKEDLARYNFAPNHMSNVRILPRNDGKYLLVARSTAPMISENVLGPYVIQGDRVYKKYEDILPQDHNEDPTIWYSGGMYHMVYNRWDQGISYHFTSKDGLKHWIYRGIAYQKGVSKIFSYTNGVENKWEYTERPCAYVDEETGHVTHFIFSVIDTGKGGDGSNDNHGSKIVVVPFDGEAFDAYMQEVIKDDPDIPVEVDPTVNPDGDNNLLNTHVFSFEAIDGDLERGWYVQHKDQFSISNEQASHGSYSLKFTNSADITELGAVQTQGFYGQAPFAIPTIESGDYTFSVKVWLDETAPNSLDLVFIGSSPFRQLVFDLTGVKHNEWVTLSQPINFGDFSTSPARKINIQLKNNAQGTMYIDELRIEGSQDTAVKEQAEDGVAVFAMDNQIIVKGAANEVVTICNVQGKVVNTCTASSDDVRIPVDFNNMYIVTVGNNSFKVHTSI